MAKEEEEEEEEEEERHEPLSEIPGFLLLWWLDSIRGTRSRQKRAPPLPWSSASLPRGGGRGRGQQAHGWVRIVSTPRTSTQIRFSADLSKARQTGQGMLPLNRSCAAVKTLLKMSAFEAAKELLYSVYKIHLTHSGKRGSGMKQVHPIRGILPIQEIS